MIIKPKQDKTPLALVYYYLSCKNEVVDNNSKLLSRYIKSAKELLTLCDFNLQKAKTYIDQVKGTTWVGGYNWTLETVIKKFLETEKLIQDNTPKDIFVETPAGKRHHGVVVGKIFKRKFDYKKDIMHIFNALSIHPDALKEIEKMGVDSLEYEEIDTHKIYRISLKKAKEVGFEKYFAGGKTTYIQLKYWEVENKNQNKLL